MKHVKLDIGEDGLVKAVGEPQHTPTPWHRNISPAYKYPIYADKNGNPKGKDWIHIAAVLPGNPNQEADLDFIIRAVNSHEALTEAAKLASDWLSHPQDFDAADMIKVMRKLDVAIKQAAQ